MFEIKNVRYRDILFIDELKIEEGEITCVVGKSGGGKTTFLKLLNNMINYDTGYIKFKGREVTEYNPVQLRRMVPMLPQNPVVFPDTIEDNFILTGEYAAKDERAEAEYKEILGRVGMGHHNLQEKVRNLSGGEKQRLALARILLLEPGILLLDEPSAALDEKTEKLIIELVANYIEEKGGTLIMVTHSSSIAEKHGQKIVTINDGQIEQVQGGNI
ncbi:MAG: ABC transporter ATP-binding protein [Halanaerobiales bacterium]